MASYDASRPLIIDPTLSYSTFLGGSDFDQATAVAVDSAGLAYVAGLTTSTNFPTTTGAFDRTVSKCDVFVSKFNPAASGAASLVYSTYLGGSQNDIGKAIAVDSSGNAYVTGQTFSNDFPTTAGAFRTTFGGVADAFVTKLNSNGTALSYSTYLGGSDLDQGRGIALDSSNNAYVTGFTHSSDPEPHPACEREQSRRRRFRFRACRQRLCASLLDLFGGQCLRSRQRHRGGFLRRSLHHRFYPLEQFSGGRRLAGYLF